MPRPSTDARAALDIANAAETEALQGHALRALSRAHISSGTTGLRRSGLATNLLRVSVQVRHGCPIASIAAILASATMKARIGDSDGADALARR